MASFQERVVSAVKLDPRVYAGVKADANAFGQAIGVVGAAAVAAGIGSVGGAGVVGGIFRFVLAWAAWVGIMFVVGTRILAEKQTQDDPRAFLRPVGFAAAPGIGQILGIVPVVGPFLMFVASCWMIVATVLGVKAALNFTDTGRAAAVVGIGLIFFVAFWFIVSALFGS
jgi:hypothetical protein